MLMGNPLIAYYGENVKDENIYKINFRIEHTYTAKELEQEIENMEKIVKAYKSNKMYIN